MLKKIVEVVSVFREENGIVPGGLDSINGDKVCPLYSFLQLYDLMGVFVGGKKRNFSIHSC